MFNLTKPSLRARPELRRSWDRLMSACTDLTRQWIYEQALDDVEAITKVSRRALVGRGSRPKVVHARWACWWMLREVAEMSYPEIGIMVGRDHSTVKHALQTIKETPAWTVIEKLIELQLERARAQETTEPTKLSEPHVADLEPEPATERAA